MPYNNFKKLLAFKYFGFFSELGYVSALDIRNFYW